MRKRKNKRGVGFFGACWKDIRKLCCCKAKHQECHCHDEVEVNKRTKE